MGYLKGLCYSCCWFNSILAGYFGLFCPLLPLLFLSNKLYRRTTDILFTFWQLYPTALLEVLCGCQVHISGDAVVPGLTSILVMNHRTRTDWNFLWPAAYHATHSPHNGEPFSRLIHPLKFVLKDAIKYIPGPGWVMQLSCFVYIKRAWATDKFRLESLVGYFSKIKYKYTLVLFPEGTDLTQYTKKCSHEYAEEHQLQKYEYVLHPRTKGFVYLAHELLRRNLLDCIYDVTLLYPDVIPQTEKDIATGNFPKIVRMHFKRYNKENLPKSNHELKRFLEKLWYKKELTLKDHYVNGNFLNGPLLKRTSTVEIYTALIFWSILPLLVAYVTIYSTLFQKLIISHTVLLLIINLFSGGFQDFEIGVYNLKRKFFWNPW